MSELVSGKWIKEFVVHGQDSPFLTGIATPAAGKLKIRINGAAEVNAAGTWIDQGDGSYRYESTVGEATGMRNVTLKILPTNAGTAGQLASLTIMTDEVPADGGTTTAAARIATATTLLNTILETGAESTVSVGDALRGSLSMAAGRTEGFQAGAINVYAMDNVTLRWQFTTNRSSGRVTKTAVNLG